MEMFIGDLLRAGVLSSALVVLVGAIIYLVGNGRSPADYRLFHSEPSDFRTVRGVLRDAIALRGRGIIQLGLLLLIATPVARVAFSIFGFAEGARPSLCHCGGDCAVDSGLRSCLLLKCGGFRLGVEVVDLGAITVFDYAAS
jgi:uncharacterized membrane protein